MFCGAGGFSFVPINIFELHSGTQLCQLEMVLNLLRLLKLCVRQVLSGL